MKITFTITHSTFFEPVFIRWSRRTTSLVSDHEFGSRAAIHLTERMHPDLPGDIDPRVVALCDGSVSGWGDIPSASAIGLLWTLARLTLACTAPAGEAQSNIMRAGMRITCDAIPE